MLENLMIDGTSKSPAVKLSATTGFLEVSGKSIPENSVAFYQPLLSWLDNYAAAPAGKTEVKVILEYFNTSSSKCLLDMFRKLEALHKSGKSDVAILWHYETEDEDMLEAGQDYESLVALPFTFVVIEG